MGDLIVVSPLNPKIVRASRRNKKRKPTADGIKIATSTKWKNNNVTQQMKHGQANVSAPVPPKFNVGMRVKESVLRSLRVSSTLTLRPLYATTR